MNNKERLVKLYKQADALLIRAEVLDQVSSFAIENAKRCVNDGKLEKSDVWCVFGREVVAETRRLVKQINKLYSEAEGLL